MKRKKLISMAVLMVLLFNMSIGVFAGSDGGTTRPDTVPLPKESVEYPTVNSCGSDGGTTRPD